MRLCSELREAYDAGDRVGQIPSFKEALMTPLVSEQVIYLDILGRELFKKFQDSDDIYEHLSDMAEADLSSLHKLQEKAFTCETCGTQICKQCGVCHTCETVDQHTHQPKTKKKVLN